MRKFLQNILKFTVFSIIFYLVFLSIWSWLMPPFMAKNVRNCIGCYGHLNTRIKEIPEFNNVDILVLGSSHAYRGFDPRVFEKHGIQVFNLGSSAQTPIQTYVLLNQYLNELNPKLVILEVYAGTLGIDGVESSLDLAANNRIDQYYLSTLPYLKNLQTINSTIYGSFRQLFDLDRNFIEDSIQDESHYIRGGYVQTRFSENPLNEEKVKPWIINENQLTYLKKNIAFLKENNYQFIMVQAPISTKLFESKTNNSEIDQLYSSLGSYVSFQNKLILNDTLDFYDSNHLNQQAVERFNEYLIEYLINNSLLYD